MGCVLILIVATGIVVVKVKTKAQPFVGIDRKLRINMVFSVLFVSTIVITDICEGGKSIKKLEFIRLLVHKTIAVNEKEFARMRAVDKDSTQSGSVVVANGVILAVETSGKNGVLVEMRYSVKVGRTNIAEMAVYSPGLYPFGYLFVGLHRVASVGVEILIGAVLFTTLSDIPVSIHFIIHLSLQRQCCAGQ